MNDEQSQINPILYRGDEEQQRAVNITAIPDRAMNVEAASLALLEEDDETALETFNQMSNIPRDQQAFWLTEEGQRKRTSYDQYIRTGLVDVLSDPTVSFQDKQSIVKKAQTDSFAPPDTSTMLMQQALVQPSKGETATGSAVRNVSATWAAQAASVLEERQSIVNTAVGKRDGSLSVVTDLLGMLVPMEAGITAGKIASKRGDELGGVLLPASYIQEIHEKFKGLPLEEQNTFLKEVAGVVSQSSGLTTSKNQLRIEGLMNDITSGSSTPGIIFENFVNLLDIVGVGTSVKAIPRMVEAAKSSAKMLAERTSNEMSANAKAWFDRTGTDVPMEAGDTRTVLGETPLPAGDITKPQYDAVPSKLNDLERQAQSMKEQAVNIMDRDTYEEVRSSLANIKAAKPKLDVRATPQDVTRFSEAKAQREKTIADLDAKMKAHDQAVDVVENKLPDVEVKINELKGKEAFEPVPMNPVAAAVDRAYNQSVMFTHNPRTPGFILGLANPEKARAIHAQVLMSQSDTLAQAIHGVTRTEALVKAVAPQLTDMTGRVKRLVDDPEEGLRAIMATQLGASIANVRDGYRYTEGELKSARANIVNDFKSVTGLTINDGMSSFSYSGDSIKVQGVYTNMNGGWASANDALEQAQFALRKRGVRPDEITLMKLDGDEFVPVKKDALTDDEGVFAVRLESEVRVNDNDVTTWDSLDVKRNLLDRFQTKGDGAGWSRFIFEPNSMLHKKLTGSMFVADDKSSVIVTALLDQFKTFTDGYVKLPKTIKADVDEYIRHANVHEVAFDPVALAARFPASVVNLLKDWRNAWDNVYILENAEVVNALTKEGYQIFKHQNVEAVVKEIKKKSYSNNRVYDPASDTIRKLTDVEMDNLYNTQGYVASFRRPINIAGADIDLMIVRNTPTEHARGLRSGDKILEYREGYYQVSYKTPKFIDEKYTDASGVERSRTVGVAGSIKDAKDAVARLTTQANGKTYSYRGDERDIRRSADAYWDLNQTSGRIAQRHRGKLLEDTVGFKAYGADDFIDNPADSAVRAATSMGGRIAMKETLDTSKERWMKQYSHLMSGPDFQKSFPASRDQIFKKGESYTKELADARTQWEYISYMENGYINGMSELSKMGFNALADALGEAGFDRVEKMSRAVADANIQGGIKGGVFASYMATNPLRQWIVQSNQHLRLIGYTNGRMPQVYDLASSFIDVKVNPKKTTQAQKEFMSFWEGTGMSQAIHRSNLIRGTLLDAANRQNKVSKAYDKTVQAGRSIGYDIGENINNLISAAAVFDKYKQAGRDVTNSMVKAEMHAETRALTRNMAYAGDMPYNQNSMQLVFTYMQVPHKFALQGLDRTVAPKNRAKLIAADLAIWGVPGTAALAPILGHDILPENEELRELAMDGLQSFLINTTLSEALGKRVGIDFSSLAPYDFGGWTDIISGVMTDGGVSALIEHAPAGNVFGLSPTNRLGYALQTTAMFFKDINSDEITKVDVKDLADSWARMTSGYTNFQEARIMYQLGKVIDKQGRTVDDSIHPLEAVAKVFGFGTKDTKGYYEALIKSSKIMKSAEDAAKSDVKLIYQMVRGLTAGDVDGARQVALISQALADSTGHPDKVKHAQYIAAMHAELQKPAWFKLHQKLAEVAGFPSTEHYGDLVKLSNLPPEDQQVFEQVMRKNVTNYRAIAEAHKD